MKAKIKGFVEKIPYSVGRHLARVPFSYRLGKEYIAFSKLLVHGGVDEQYVISTFNKIFRYAKTNLPLYRQLYSDYDVMDLDIESIQDIQRVPVITKDMIRDHLDEFLGSMKINTGGTSGNPFAFYIDKNAFAREWAHMHYIWSLKGYSYRNIKLTLRGKNLGKTSIAYNPVHNEFIVNTYQDAAKYIDELIELVSSKDIKYLHGYPSAIYNFLKELEAAGKIEELGILKSHFRYCLLGSEFPVPYMVNYIKKEWGLDYISWYGHSEMCVLAYDRESTNNYTPFHSYGYAEVIDNRLIGTSYHNFDMPLIRYDTGDLVEPKFESGGLLSSFSIKEGRSGDFIEDSHGKQIPLTALVFGRHHEIFERVDCIQVRQQVPGKVEFLLTTKSELTAEEAKPLIDISNVDIESSIKIIRTPILTSSGKMPLKVN